MQVPLTSDPDPILAERTHIALISVVFRTVTSLDVKFYLLSFFMDDQRYDCVAQEMFPHAIIFSFMCVHWEAAPHQCLSVSMLTCFLSVHGDKKLQPSLSDQRWFSGYSAAFHFSQQLFSDPCRPRFWIFLSCWKLESIKGNGLRSRDRSGWSKSHE